MTGMQNKYQVIAALAVIHHGAKAASLQDYLSEEAKARMQSELQVWTDLEEVSRQALLQHYLKTVRLQQDLSSITEIHPAWLVEPLKNESPRVVGVILRHIPSKHVRYILEHLPARTVAQMPKLIESFYVPKEILNLIRRRFERHFLPMRTSRMIRKFE